MSIPLWPPCMSPSSDGYFQQDNAPCHKARIISNWFLEHDNDFTVLKWPPQSPDLNQIEHLLDVVEREFHALDVHPTSLHQLQDAILSIWANISKKYCKHLVESMPGRIKAVLNAKGGQTQNYYGVPNNPLGECVYIYCPPSSCVISFEFCMNVYILQIYCGQYSLL